MKETEAGREKGSWWTKKLRRGHPRALLTVTPVMGDRERAGTGMRALAVLGCEGEGKGGPAPLGAASTSKSQSRTTVDSVVSGQAWFRLLQAGFSTPVAPPTSSLALALALPRIF